MAAAICIAAPDPPVARAGWKGSTSRGEGQPAGHRRKRQGESTLPGQGFRAVISRRQRRAGPRRHPDDTHVDEQADEDMDAAK
eukprot:gene18814-37895_t